MSNLVSINLDQEDIRANDRGVLSKAQTRALYQHRLLILAKTLGFAGILVSLFILLFLKLRLPSFANHGELFFWIPISLFWLWLLRLSPMQWFRINADLREGKIAQVEGRVVCRWRNTFGLIQFPGYEIQVSNQVFPLSGDEFFKFTNQGDYRIISSPRAKVFLGAVPITGLPDHAAENGVQIHPPEVISDLLTARELEILKLLADGLSNKEIANQLSLSVNTIKMYASRIYQKLGVSRRTEAVALARKRGIL